MNKQKTLTWKNDNLINVMNKSDTAPKTTPT